jgi:hypothetical protein
MDFTKAPSVNALGWLREHSHGVVWARPDGLRARCMGPPSDGYEGCAQCGYEQMIVGLLMELDGQNNSPTMRVHET